MRPVHQLVHSRARVTQRYALLPLEGFPFSRLPSFPTAQVRVLASPRMGAEFVQYLIDLPSDGRGTLSAEDGVETFYFVLRGTGKVSEHAAKPIDLVEGCFGLIPPGRGLEFVAGSSLSLILLKKRYEPADRIELFASLHSHESTVAKAPWADSQHSLLQNLVPDELQFDLSMNIFTFTPGYGLPIVETHVMEHGLYFLQGKGVYYLDGDWMEVEKDDFIWMGPYCPQSYYATGPTPSQYLYYKNVNREISL